MVSNHFIKLFAWTYILAVNIRGSYGSDYSHVPENILDEYRIILDEYRGLKWVQDHPGLNSLHYLWKVLSLYHKIHSNTFMKTKVICLNNTPSIDYDDLRMQNDNLLKSYNESYFASLSPKEIEDLNYYRRRSYELVDSFTAAVDFSKDILNAAKIHPVYYLLYLNNSTIEEYLDLKNTRHFAHFEKIEKATNIYYEEVKDTWWTKGHYYQYDKEQWLLYTFHQSNLSWLLGDDFCNQSSVNKYNQSMIGNNVLKRTLKEMIENSFDIGYKNILLAESVFSTPITPDSDAPDELCHQFLPELEYGNVIDDVRSFLKYIIIHYCVFSISLIGNMFVIASVLTMKKITKNAILKLSLAITDLITVIAVLVENTMEATSLLGFIKWNNGGYYNEFQEVDVFPGYKSSNTQLEREFDLRYENWFEYGEFPMANILCKKRLPS